MNEIINVHQALIYLKEKKILISYINNERHYFMYKRKQIVVFNKNIRYFVDESTFIDLFYKNEFVLYENDLESEIDIFKDQEYYRWKK